jgi:hypothetical protein
MAAPPDSVLFRDADFPKDSWVNPFLRPLNRFINQVVSALRGQLTLAQNHAAALRTVNITIANTAADNRTFTPGLPGKTNIVAVVSAVNTITGFNKIWGSVTANWKDNGNGTVTVSALTGLSAGQNYDVTYLFMAEPL